ncbi:MAG: hypothetical protein ABW071_04970 [Casimicrobiaceae bacterium]
MTPTPPNAASKAPRKARRKVTTDLGRQLLTRERQRLSREQAALAEQQLQEAERRRTQQKRNVQSHKPIDVAVSRSIVKRFAGVLASEGISVRITCTPSRRTSAWTDFEQIVINYEQQDDDRVLAATLRGLAYHEGGHCRFTLPFMQLAEAAGQTIDSTFHRAWNILEDQRMETAVVSDSPRKAAYLTPLVMLKIVPSISAAASNYPLLIWRRFLPKHIRKGARKLFVKQHNLMGINGEVLARSLERVTTKYVLADNAVTMWEAVVEYQGLLQQVGAMSVDTNDGAMGHQRQYRRPERNLDDYLVIPVSGEDEDEPTEDEEADEKDAIDSPDEFKQFFDVLVTILNGGDVVPVIYAKQRKSESEGDGQGSNKSDEQQSADPSDEEGESEGEGSEGESEGDDAGKEYANEPVESDDKGGSTGAHKNTGVREDLDYKPEGEGSKGDDEGDDEADTELSDEDLQEALDEAAAERDADPALDADVQALHEAINNRASDLMPYTAGVSTDAEAKAAADNLAQDIEQAFQENTVEKAPGWVEQQRRGIVNVLRYETRRPGDVEFFRAYTDTDAPGQNIAVSVLLDYSSSMSGATKELAQAGYATKIACQNLDIPCTVVLWDTDATVLWDAHEVAEDLPVIVATGGTDPTVAVADLDRQRFDKETHVVLIMTDGAWSGPCAQQGFLANYKGEGAGRYFIGLGYNSGWGDNAEAMAENLRRYGCDEAHGIENLMDIPRFLEQALIAFS